MVPNRALYNISAHTWVKVFKNGPSKIYGRKTFKKLNWYGLPKQTISLQIFNDCIPQILFGPFLMFHHVCLPFWAELSSYVNSNFMFWKMVIQVLLLCPYIFILINVNYSNYAQHCLKSVQIRSYFWTVFSCIRTEYGDLWI